PETLGELIANPITPAIVIASGLIIFARLARRSPPAPPETAGRLRSQGLEPRAARQNPASPNRSLRSMDHATLELNAKTYRRCRSAVLDNFALAAEYYELRDATPPDTSEQLFSIWLLTALETATITMAEGKHTPQSLHAEIYDALRRGNGTAHELFSDCFSPPKFAFLIDAQWSHRESFFQTWANLAQNHEPPQLDYERLDFLRSWFGVTDEAAGIMAARLGLDVIADDPAVNRIASRLELTAHELCEQLAAHGFTLGHEPDSIE
ncbi:MAG: hypothetical protein GY953_22300, partial [bacterium]|nr:hypothetical protein [bacterium]